MLALTVFVAGVFAFAPVDQASTVHNTIQSSLEIKDIYADVDTAASTNNDAITFDFLLVSQDGDGIVGLDETDMTADFTAGTTSGGETIAVTDSGSGSYRITVQPTNDWDAGRTSIVLTATDDDGNSASTLLVVDIT